MTADTGTTEEKRKEPLPAWTVAAILVIVAVVLVARQLLLESGLVVGSDQTRLLTLAAVGIAVFAIAWQVGTESVGRLIAGGAALAGLFAATELVWPAVPDASAPSACPGAQTRNVDFLAVTHRDGVSVRTGPGRSFRQRDRLLGNCTIGFLGYCLGEPTEDVFYVAFGQRIGDARWLVLPHGRGYVAAGAVRSQEAEDRLPGPRKDCPAREEFEIGAPDIRIPPGPVAGEVEVVATARRAPTVGFATYHVDAGEPVFTRVALDASFSGPFGFTWLTHVQPAPSGPGQGDVVLVAVSCLAAEVPGPASAVTVPLGNGGAPQTAGVTTRPVGLDSIHPDHRVRLLRKACLLPGDGIPPVKRA